MENTLENKANFFAQYIVAEPQVLTSNSMGHLNVETYHLNIKNGFEKRCLLLKSLSQLSDEDKHEVFVIEDAFNEAENITIHFSSNFDTCHFINEWDEVEFKRPLLVQSYQYLQSKAYALPWMGLSVEQLISFGWVKLKEG